MLKKIGMSAVVAIATFLGCVVLGILFSSTDVKIGEVIGEFLTKNAYLIGLLSGIWYFFTH